MKEDAAAKKVAEMSDEEVSNKFKEMMNSADTKDNKFIDSLPSSNGVTEAINNTRVPEEGEATVNIDPVTGVYQEFKKENGITDELENMLDLKPEDLLDIPDSIYDIELPDDVIIKNIQEGNNIADKELAIEILNIVKKYRQTGPEFRENIDWYSKLPKRVQALIDKSCLEVNNNTKAAKKVYAQFFIEQIISDSGMDKIIIDFQDSMEKALDTSGITEYILSESKTQFEKQMESAIEATKKSDNIDEEKKKELIEKQERVLEAFHHAYTYDTFIEACESHKVKVKPFDISKYKRWLSTFYTKYEGDTPFVIKDPALIPPTLKRFYGDKYTDDQYKAFVIAYIKFIINMNPNDVVDHTYMSYFIHNITQLDLIKHKSTEEDFLNIISNSIERALIAINGIKSNESEE